MKWGSKNLPKTETCNDLHIEMGLCGDGVFISPLLSILVGF